MHTPADTGPALRSTAGDKAVTPRPVQQPPPHSEVGSGLGGRSWEGRGVAGLRHRREPAATGTGLLAHCYGAGRGRGAGSLPRPRGAPGQGWAGLLRARLSPGTPSRRRGGERRAEEAESRGEAEEVPGPTRRGTAAQQPESDGVRGGTEPGQPPGAQKPCRLGGHSAQRPAVLALPRAALGVCRAHPPGAVAVGAPQARGRGSSRDEAALAPHRTPVRVRVEEAVD